MQRGIEYERKREGRTQKRKKSKAKKKELKTESRDNEITKKRTYLEQKNQ